MSHARALRRYLAIIVELLWPVRSATHVSVRPVASEQVVNVARGSWALIGCRLALRSNSFSRVMRAALGANVA
jgi:hypothetical protein